MNTNTGGPAFPIPDTYHASGQVQYGTHGMTLLDWFAGQALGALVSRNGSGANPEIAYDLAVLMLAEKARREAVVKESSTTDHSPDAGKMAKLESLNRELVEAAQRLLECRGHGSWIDAAKLAIAALAKAKEVA